MLGINENDRWRLGFHLMPPTGWLNDPNGLCEFNGEYHVFFQYTPDNPEGGMKYWGHYLSKNLVEWEYAGIALSPEEEFEKCGVYSGSALVAGGRMNLFYTGNVKLQGDYNYITDGRQANTILVCSEDGRTFGEKKCLLTNTDYPENLTCHVRDPKVVPGKSIGAENNKNYMFLGARTQDDEGEVLVYESSGTKNWKLVNTLTSTEKFGYMWECPDAFMLDGRKILSVSPQGVEEQEGNYQNLYQSGYFELTGRFEGSYRLKRFKEWDRGFDFYAPQTFEDSHGRRILIGWIGMPDDPGQRNPTVARGWQNALTVPREVFLKDGKVMQYPVKEISALQKKEETLRVGESSRAMRMYDAHIETKVNSDIIVTVSDGIKLQYSLVDHYFTLEFLKEYDLGCGRRKRSVYLEKCSAIRILADTSCLEIYLNGGEEVFTTRFYTDSGASSFCIEKGAEAATYWEMNPMKYIVPENIL